MAWPVPRGPKDTCTYCQVIQKVVLQTRCARRHANLLLKVGVSHAIITSPVCTILTVVRLRRL